MEHPFEAYDAATEQRIRVRLVLLGMVCDNPMASEVSCHIGTGGNKLCRRCEVGGSNDDRMSNDGYHSLFKVS